MCDGSEAIVTAGSGADGGRQALPLWTGPRAESSRASAPRGGKTRDAACHSRRGTARRSRRPGRRGLAQRVRMTAPTGRGGSAQGEARGGHHGMDGRAIRIRGEADPLLVDEIIRLIERQNAGRIRTRVCVAGGSWNRGRGARPSVRHAGVRPLDNLVRRRGKLAGPGGRGFVHSGSCALLGLL